MRADKRVETRVTGKTRVSLAAVAAVFVLASALNGCGQSGDLVLPDRATQEVDETTAGNQNEDEQVKKRQGDARE